jgi:DNA-binding MarR family transcriptional regulator
MTPQHVVEALAGPGIRGRGVADGRATASAARAAAAPASAVRAAAAPASAVRAAAAPASAPADGAPAGDLPPLVSEWRSLAARHAAVCAALEHELGERHGLGVSEFEVLERLAENEHTFRVQELAEAVHLSQSTLSRLIARLEQHGLVRRSMCDADRRGIDVCLTEAGRERHAQARPTHRAVLAATMPPAGS